MRKLLQSSCKIIANILFVVIFLQLPNKSVFASEISYFEDFNDGIADGWTTTLLQNCLTSNWEVKDGMYGFKVSSDDAINGCKTYTILTSQQIPSDADYVYEFDMKFSNSVNVDRNFFIKYTDLDNWYDVHLFASMIHLEKVYNATHDPNTFPIKYYNFLADQAYHFKISVYGNLITIDIDNNFHESYVDPDPVLQNKYVGLKASTGYVLSSEVWFDNISLKIYPSIIKFNLPYNYLNRDDPSEPEFKTEFWDKMTASFDHDRTKNIYTPFTTQSFDNKDCPKNALGITCYDGHNGTDFRPSIPKANEDVYPVADGKVVYASEKDKNGKCNSEKSGYGCVIVMYHPDLDVYSLYAHLSEITKPISDTTVGFSESIGKMGNTGCYPCGVHIHLGVLKDNTPLETKKKMKAADWESLFIQAEPKSNNKINTSPKHYCTYKVPNGNILSFQDPSGWSDELTQDPWAFPSDMGGCGIDSPYLWMHNIGTVAIDVNLPKLWYSERLN